MKTNLTIVVLSLLLAVAVFMWLSKPQPKIVYKNNPADSLNRVIKHQQRVIYLKDSAITALSLRYDSLHRIKIKQGVYLKKLKKDYDTTRIVIANNSVNDDLLYFRTKFAEDSNR